MTLKRPVTAYIDLVLRNRLAFCLGVLTVTIAAGLVCTRAVISSSLAGLFFGDSPDYLRYVERTREFGNDDLIVIGFDEDDPLGASALERLEKAVEGISLLPDVGNVTSVLDAQRILARGDDIVVEGYGDAAREDPSRRSELLDALRDDPFFGGLFVSRDGRASAVAIELTPEPYRPGERVPAFIDAVLDAFEAAGFERAGLHRAGFPAAVSEVMEQAYFNIGRIFPLSAVLLLLAVWLLFRRFWPVVITGVVSLVAVIWTGGFLVLLDHRVSIMATLLPVVILIISFSDVVHLCSSYLTEVSAGLEKDQAVRTSGSEVGAACFLTSVTTFVGFVSMSFVPTPAFRLLGLSLGFGVGVALLLAITLTPILLSWMPRPRPWRRGEEGGIQGALDWLLELCVRWATGRPILVTAAFGALLLASIVGMSKIEIETDFVDRLDEDNYMRRDAAWLEERFAGSLLLDAFVDTSDAGGILDARTFVAMATLQDRIAELPGVDHAMSMVDLVRDLHAAARSEATPTESGVPTSPGALAQYLLLFEMAGGERLDRLVDFERRTARISVRLSGSGFMEAARVGEEIRRLAASTLGDRATVDPAGLQYLLGAWLDEILAGQRRGLLFAFLAVAVMMVLGLGSLYVGLWSMVPNMLPLAALGGYLGLFWDTVDSDVAVIAMVAIGIGVDDTIHFLMRLRLEWDRCESPGDAIRAAQRYAGRGIVITTAILVMGFLPFALSDYLSTQIFGTLMPYCLVIALLADLLLVPALVQLGWVGYGGRSRERGLGPPCP